MWYLLLLVALTASAADPDREKLKQVRLKYIVTNQDLHLDKLVKELHHLEEQFDHLSEDVDADDVKHLKARVHNLEEEHHHECEEYEGSCGGDVPQCISKLLFCDGHKDCRNGNDEDDDHCDVAPAHVGSSYTGVATWDSCEDLLPHHVVVTITASKRKDFFSAVVWVRGILSFQEERKGQQIRTYQLRGLYVLGQRTLLLGPERGTKPIYGVRCEFKFGDDDSADCKIVNPASHSVCAHFQAARY